MKISMIAAMANDRVIGNNKQMPWHLPADLKHFKAITLGKPVIMGRLTYESIGKALPGRKNIVISANKELVLNDALVVNSCEAALAVASIDADEVMIIGGGSIYEAFLAQAHQLYLTFIHLQTQGDTRFPDYQSIANWRTTQQDLHNKDDKNPYDYEFVTLVKT